MWTHFVVGQGTITVCSTDTCEVCGKRCEAPNAVTAYESVQRLLSLGMRQLPKRLPELYHCDALDLATCPDCYKEEE